MHPPYTIVDGEGAEVRSRWSMVERGERQERRGRGVCVERQHGRKRGGER